MMMEIDNDEKQQEWIVNCEEEEEQNGGRMNGGGDEKKKTTKQRTSDEEEDIDDDDDVESVDDDEEEKRTRERRIEKKRRGGGAKSTIPSNSYGMIDEDDEGVEMRSTKSAMIITTIINNNNKIHEKEGDDVGLKGKCKSLKNNEKERDLECFGSADDDGVDYEGDEFNDCGKKDVDWNWSVGGDSTRGKEKKRKNSNNNNNDQNEKNNANCDDGRARIASRSEIAPAGIPDDEDEEEEEMNDGGGGMSDLVSSNKNNNNNLMMNLNGMEGCKRANVRILFSENSNNNSGGGSEMSKRRSCYDNENNDTFSSSSSSILIGKRSRIESEDGHGSAFRRVGTLPKRGLNDGRWNGCETGKRFDFGSDVVFVKREKTDDLESDRKMIGNVVVNNNNSEVEMSNIDREVDGFEFGIKSEKDGSPNQASSSPPIEMQQEDNERDYDECDWSCSDNDNNNNNIADGDGNSSDASYNPSPIEANRRQARSSQHRKTAAAEACKRRESHRQSSGTNGVMEDEETTASIIDDENEISDMIDGSSRRPNGYWDDFRNVEKEIRSFIKRMGDKIEAGRMPTKTQLLDEGCSGLITAILRHGGLGAVAERLGLASPTKPRGYWDDFANVERELRSFIERMGDKIERGRMPTQQQLLDEGCSGLVNAIQKHGGSGAVAERLGLGGTPRTKPYGYGDDFSSLERRMRSFIEKMGDKIEPGTMPSNVLLRDEGCFYLIRAIRKHGGTGHVAERLGLVVAPRKLRGYWDDFSNVQKEIRSFIKRMGDKIDHGRMPTQKQLLDEGCSNLVNGITKHGGYVAVALRLGLVAAVRSR